MKIKSNIYRFELLRKEAFIRDYRLDEFGQRIPCSLSIRDTNRAVVFKHINGLICIYWDTGCYYFYTKSLMKQYFKTTTKLPKDSFLYEVIITKFNKQ